VRECVHKPLKQGDGVWGEGGGARGQRERERETVRACVRACMRGFRTSGAMGTSSGRESLLKVTNESADIGVGTKPGPEERSERLVGVSSEKGVEEDWVGHAESVP
jgi:hypothetical protein